MLEAVALSKRYHGIPALENVSFSLKRGQVLGCLGPNGAGKSTTVKLLLGLIEPTHGEVLFDGYNIRHHLVDYRKRLGYVPEEPNLYPYLSGQEYLELVATLRGIERNRRTRKISALLEQFAMYENRHGTIATYSKGMRQRILIIAALMDNPELLIFDEPLSGLDVVTALVFKNLILALGQSGKCVFYCSHVLEVVEKVCSHLMILERGHVLAYGEARELPGVTREASLEQTFARLINEIDAQQLTRNILDAMVNA